MEAPYPSTLDMVHKTPFGIPSPAPLFRGAVYMSTFVQQAALHPILGRHLVLYTVDLSRIVANHGLILHQYAETAKYADQ